MKYIISCISILLIFLGLFFLVSSIKHSYVLPVSKGNFQSYIPIKSTKITQTPSNIPTKPLGNQTLVDIQTWVYPGPPGCNAFKELSDGRSIDTVKIEFFTLSDNGRLKLVTEEDEGCNGYNSKNVSFVKQYSKYQYVTVSSDGVRMRNFFSNADFVKETLATLVSFTKNENFTGVEIDFEDFSSWTPKDYAEYKQFISNLHIELKKNDKKLIIDTPPVTSSTQQWYPFKYEDFNNITDFFSVMTYDYQFDEGVGNAVAPNNWVRYVLAFVSSKVPKDKIIVGVPSYGYEGKTGSMKLEIKTKEQISSNPGFNSAKEDPNSFESSFTSNGTFYLYQTKSGLSKKVRFIQSLGYNKISIWHLGGNDWFE